MEPRGCSHLIVSFGYLRAYSAQAPYEMTSDTGKRQGNTLAFNVHSYRKPKEHARHGKADGQLVLLGWDVAALTPAAYRRRSLRRPCEI